MRITRLVHHFVEVVADFADLRQQLTDFVLVDAFEKNVLTEVLQLLAEFHVLRDVQGAVEGALAGHEEADAGFGHYAGYGEHLGVCQADLTERVTRFKRVYFLEYDFGIAIPTERTGHFTRNLIQYDDLTLKNNIKMIVLLALIDDNRASLPMLHPQMREKVRVAFFS